MKAIVVVDENWAIGKNGGLLVHLPGDLKYFKEKTLGKTIIMGRATLESLPGGKPLPERTTIVLSKDEALKTALEGKAVVVNSMGALFGELMQRGQMEKAFVAGGEKVYRQFLPYCNEIYVTKLEATYSDADKYFPNLDEQGIWEQVEESERHEENGVGYRFTLYRKK